MGVDILKLPRDQIIVHQAHCAYKLYSPPEDGLWSLLAGLVVTGYASTYAFCEIVEKHHKILVSTGSEGELKNINLHMMKWSTNGYEEDGFMSWSLPT